MPFSRLKRKSNSSTDQKPSAWAGRMVPALYLNAYNLLILPLIFSFILFVCLICLNSYLAFPTIKHQGLWPLFHSSHTDTTDLWFVVFFHCTWTNANMQKTTLFALAAPQDFHNYSMGGHQASPASESGKARPIYVRGSIPDSSSSGHWGGTATEVHCNECARAMFKCWVLTLSTCLLWVLTSKIICRCIWQCETLEDPRWLRAES